MPWLETIILIVGCPTWNHYTYCGTCVLLETIILIVGCPISYSLANYTQSIYAFCVWIMYLNTFDNVFYSPHCNDTSTA